MRPAFGKITNSRIRNRILQYATKFPQKSLLNSAGIFQYHYFSLEYT